MHSSLLVLWLKSWRISLWKTCCQINSKSELRALSFHPTFTPLHMMFMNCKVKTQPTASEICNIKDKTLLTKVCVVQAMVFPLVMYGPETWTINKAECQRIDASELWCWRTLVSPLDSKEVKPVSLKGYQPWIFIKRTDAEAEAPVLWPPDAKNQLIRKEPEAGKDWGQEEKGVTEVEMVGWHHWLYGHEFEQTPGDSRGQRGLTCCSPRGRKESDTT